MCHALVRRRGAATLVPGVFRVKRAQGLHGLVERVAQLHDGPARNEDGVRLRVAALLDLEVRAGVILFDVHENPLASREEARRKNLLLVFHGLGAWHLCSFAKALKSGIWLVS